MALFVKNASGYEFRTWRRATDAAARGFDRRRAGDGGGSGRRRL
jgi:hypothetical protein